MTMNGTCTCGHTPEQHDPETWDCNFAEDECGCYLFEEDWDNE